MSEDYDFGRMYLETTCGIEIDCELIGEERDKASVRDGEVLLAVVNSALYAVNKERLICGEPLWAGKVTFDHKEDGYILTFCRQDNPSCFMMSIESSKEGWYVRYGDHLRMKPDRLPVGCGQHMIEEVIEMNWGICLDNLKGDQTNEDES